MDLRNGEHSKYFLSLFNLNSALLLRCLPRPAPPSLNTLLALILFAPADRLSLLFHSLSTHISTLPSPSLLSLRLIVPAQMTLRSSRSPHLPLAPRRLSSGARVGVGAGWLKRHMQPINTLCHAVRLQRVTMSQQCVFWVQ